MTHTHYVLQAQTELRIIKSHMNAARCCWWDWDEDLSHNPIQESQMLQRHAAGHGTLYMMFFSAAQTWVKMINKNHMNVAGCCWWDWEDCSHNLIQKASRKLQRLAAIRPTPEKDRCSSQHIMITSVSTQHTLTNILDYSYTLLGFVGTTTSWWRLSVYKTHNTTIT